jgi:hypothetical protein
MQGRVGSAPPCCGSVSVFLDAGVGPRCLSNPAVLCGPPPLLGARYVSDHSRLPWLDSVCTFFPPPFCDGRCRSNLLIASSLGPWDTGKPSFTEVLLTNLDLAKVPLRVDASRLLELSAGSVVRHTVSRVSCRCPAEVAQRAVVVGSNAYRTTTKFSRVQLCVNDAIDFGSLLVTKGYDVTEALDGTKRQVEDALNWCASRYGDVYSSGSSFITLFFSGHGIQLGGVNYLVPVDALDAEGALLLTVYSHDDVVSMQAHAF